MEEKRIEVRMSLYSDVSAVNRMTEESRLSR